MTFSTMVRNKTIRLSILALTASVLSLQAWADDGGSYTYNATCADGSSYQQICTNPNYYCEYVCDCFTLVGIFMCGPAVINCADCGPPLEN